MICQVCSTRNEADRELCRKCQSKLLVVSGAMEAYDEGPPGEPMSLDEHLLERVSVLEEIVKRTAETLKTLLDGLTRQEKNGFVVQTGLLALKDLLERRGLLAESEFLDLWEGRVDQHMAALEKRERFLERKERLLAGYHGDHRERFVAHLSEAELSFYALETEKAMAALEEAWKLDRSNVELAFTLGETCFNDGDVGKAFPFLRAVLEKSPSHFEALVYAGVLEGDLGRPEQAIETLRKALAARPGSFLPTFALGALHAGTGQLARAEGYLREAVAIEENPQAYSLLGAIAHERGRVRDAIDALQRAVKLDPADEEAVYLLGLCYLERGWVQKAAERFRSALELHPGRVDLKEAVDLVRSGGRDGLASAARGAAAEWLERAEGLSARDPEKAFQLYGRALALAPEDPAIQVSHALAGAALGRTAEAMAAARRILGGSPGEPVAAAAWTTLLESLRAEGRFREGSRVAGEMLAAVRSRHARSIAYFQRAVALAEMGEELDAALADAEKAMKLSPRGTRRFPLAAKGWVHYKRREYDRAVACLEEAARLGATSTSLAHLGLAYLALGDAGAAREVLGRARRRGSRPADRRPGLEARMLEQVRRNLQLAERVGSRGKAR